MRPVIVVGDLMADVVASAAAPLAHASSDTPARITHRPGGGGANVAARLVEQGVPALLVARVGEDTPGRAAVEDLRRAGVELEVAVDALNATGTCIVIVEPGGERTMLPDRGANAALEPSDLPIDEFAEGRPPPPLRRTRCSTPASRPAALVAPEHARATGMSISVDPASAAPLQEVARPQLLFGWTPLDASLLLPNADEAAVLSGATPRPPRGCWPATAARW